MGMDFADWLTLSLFQEATQLKTVPTVVAVIRADSSKMEIQAVGIGIREGRRPAESAGADVTQRAVMRVAEARSRVKHAARNIYYIPGRAALIIGEGTALSLRRRNLHRRSRLPLRGRRSSVSKRLSVLADRSCPLSVLMRHRSAVRPAFG